MLKLCVVCILLLGLPGASAQVDKYEWLVGDFGRSVFNLGDLDGDGADEVAVPASNQGDGRVYILSGPELKKRLTLDPTIRNGWFGSSVCRGADFDQDGVMDVLVGADGDEEWCGAVEAFSGKSGESLFSLQGSAGGDTFGARLAAIGDVNGDGWEDFMVGAPDVFKEGPGRAMVYSGKNRQTMLVLSGGEPGDFLGSSLAGGADLDGDGTPDFVVGAPQRSNPKTPGYVMVAWGGDRKPSFVRGFTPYEGGVRVSPRDADLSFGGAIALCDDLDGDALPELLIHTNTYGREARIEIRNGKDLTLIRTISGDSRSGFGRPFAIVDDRNEDGIRDILVGAYDTRPGGAAFVLSLATGETLLELRPSEDDWHFGVSACGYRPDGPDAPMELLVGHGAMINNSVPGVVRLMSPDGRKPLLERALSDYADD